MKPKICVVITRNDYEMLEKAIEYKPDLIEMRIDMIGNGWEDLTHECNLPWIATNRKKNQGGFWKGDERERIEQLKKAVELGASMVDVELTTKNLDEIVDIIKSNRSKCLISYHDFQKTPNLATLRKIVKKQIDAEADVWKVVTTAKRFEDNLTTLQLIREFDVPGVSFAMGNLGLLSRVLCPLVGGSFTYACVERGKESAPGQTTVKELRKIYKTMKV